MVRIAVKTVAAIALLVVLVLVATAGRVWWVARQDDTRTSDVIVVLGGPARVERADDSSRWGL